MEQFRESFKCLMIAVLKAWEPIAFRLSGSDTNAASVGRYMATDVRVVRVEADMPAEQAPRLHVFKLMVQ